MKKVILGGTFSVIHKGHEKILDKAFQIGEVTIGLTSDEFIKSRKKYETIPYEIRKEKRVSAIPWMIPVGDIPVGVFNDMLANPENLSPFDKTSLGM